MNSILITGGAGFIGSNLALHLVSEGHDVTVLDNLSPQIHGADPEQTSPLYAGIRDKVRFIRGDVCDPAVWPRCLPGRPIRAAAVMWPVTRWTTTPPRCTPPARPRFQASTSRWTWASPSP